jgi:hypothetical protein
MRIVCHICGNEYHGGERGGHCRGGKYGGCCQTFSNDATGDKHRPVGGPCLTPAEMTALGWRETPRGWTHWPPMTDEAVARRRTPANPTDT